MDFGIGLVMYFDMTDPTHTVHVCRDAIEHAFGCLQSVEHAIPASSE